MGVEMWFDSGSEIVSKRRRRRLGQLAREIKAEANLREETRNFLAEVLQRVADGEDPNDVLGLSRAIGEKELNERHRLNLAVMFHWIMAAIEPEDNFGFGLNVSQAIDAAATLSQGLAWKSAKGNLELHPALGRGFPRMTSEGLRKAWYNKRNAGLKQLELRPQDFDFPY
jgi:hypothetical protein